MGIVVKDKDIKTYNIIEKRVMRDYIILFIWKFSL